MRTPAKILAWLALAILVACGQGDSSNQAKKFGGGGNGGFQPGPGLTQCSHDGTLTGNCTAALPLSVIGAAGSGSATFSAITDTGPLGVSGTSTLAGVTATSLSDSGPLILTGSIAPTALAGSVNNYAPCDVTTPANCLATTNLVRQDASVASTVTGLAAQASGQAVALLNISATNSITLTNEDTNSTAPNRFTLPNGASWVIPPGGAVLLRYSSATSRWRPEQSNNNNVMATAFANAGATTFTGTQTDSFTTTQNDYALNANVTRLVWTGNTATTTTGIAGGIDGRLLIIENLSASGNSLSLTNESASSAAANRFSQEGNATLALTTVGSNATFIYDAAASRWRLIGYSSAQVNAGKTFTNNLRLSGAVTPAALTGVTQNDYAPSGSSGSTSLRQDVTTADTTLTGLNVAQANGTIFTVTNISTGFNLLLTNEDAGSTAANRYLGDSGASCMLPKGTSMTLRYDGTSLRWRGITPCPSPILETIAGTMVGITASSAEVRGDVAASATVPTLIPNQSGTNTGIGALNNGTVDVIAAGATIARFSVNQMSMVGNGIIVGGANASTYELSGANTSATVPTLIPNRGDTTTGIGANAAGVISLITGGAEAIRVSGTTVAINFANLSLFGSNASSYGLNNAAASATIPTLVPNRSSTTSGVGADLAGHVSLIAGGVEVLRTIGSGILVLTNSTAITIGDGTNVGSSVTFSGSRVSVGYDGTNAYIQGAASKGVVLAANNAATTSAGQLVVASGGGSVGIGGTISSTSALTGATIIATAFHLLTNGTALTTTNLSACGTTPAINAKSTDIAGQITEGTTATGCTLTFANTYTVAPFCVCNASTAIAIGCNATATALTIVNASASGDVINYHCIGANGGT